MLMISLFLYCLSFFRGVLHQIVKYANRQITDLCNRKAKAITVPIPNFAFAHQCFFQATDRICEML